MKTIYLEHERTNEFTKPQLERKLKEIDINNLKERKYYECFYIAKKIYLDEYFKVINLKYNSFDNYVRNIIKISEVDEKILKSRYLINN